jgi:integrase
MATAARRPRRSWGKIHRERSGRYQATYVGPDQARHGAPATFTAKMDAERWLADERRLIEHDTWTPPTLRAAVKRARGISVAEYAATWIEQRPIKPRTRQGYRELLAGPLSPLHRVPLAALSSEAVRAWFAGLPDTPTRNSHAYGLLHAVLATAVTDGHLGANPCNLKGAMNPPTKRQPVILTPDEVAKLADAIAPERLRALILVAAWCGLRWGELVELRRRDIDTARDVITVSRSATHRNGTCKIDTPKTHKPRAVVVPPHIRDDLHEHLARYVANDPEALVFPAVHSCHLNDRVFRDYFTDAVKAVGREGVRVHDLRHFAGTMTASVGTLRETMDRLGHSTVKAAMIYQGIAAGRDRAVADGLSGLAAVPTSIGR